MTLKRVHQLLGLSVAALWLIQVATGVLLTFRQEIDNSLAGGSSAPLNVESLGQRIQSIQADGGTVSSVWVYNFSQSRFDVLYSDRAHSDRKMRVDGAGQILRDGPDDAFSNGGFFEKLTDIHTTLLMGDRGKLLIAFSGLLLLSNVIFGLKLAWPPRGYWRKSLVLKTSRNAAANFYGLHRTLGLYIGFPLLLIVCAGIGLCFDDDIEDALGVAREPPASVAATAAPENVAAAGAPEVDVSPARALTLGLARFPGATLTALSMPTPTHPWYRVRLHVPGEVPRMYGQSAVYLSAKDGSVLREYSAAAASSPGRLFLDLLYPVHTAEAGGVVARALLLCIGLSLLTMGYFGIRLWYLRRRARGLAGSPVAKTSA